MGKKGYIIYSVFLVMAVSLIVMAFLCTSNNENEEHIYEIRPTEIIKNGEYEKHYIFDLSKLDIDEEDFMFFSKHVYIKAYADGELIYECTKDGGIWGHTTGALWNFIDIPYGVKELRVECIASYDMVKDLGLEFYFGDKLAMFQDIYRESIPTLLVSMLIIIFGVVLVAYWLFLVRKFTIGKDMLLLGLFALFMGMYLLNETDASIIAITQRTASVMLTYIMLLTLVPTSIILIKEFVGLVENIIWKLLVIVSVVELVIFAVLQFADIYDMRETLIITHIMIGITAIYILINFVILFVKKKDQPMLKASFLGILVLAISLAANMISYYFNTAASDTGVYGRIGFLLFVIILSRESIKNTMDLLERGKKAEVYIELATKDMLTGLNNRNAYISDIENITKHDDLMVITFDLNDLKKCNDNYGHAEGDNYIEYAAKIINEVFSTYGSCYRIGGDEFCVIIRQAGKCPIEELIELMEQKEKAYHCEAEDFKMYIAYGYAVFDANLDDNIEDTRSRADIAMYDNKKESKC